MSAMTVAYLTYTGTAVGAFTTATPGPAIDPARLSGLTLPVRTGGGSLGYVSVTFGPGEVATFPAEAEFTNPADVLDWRVVTTTTPDGKIDRRLDRLLNAGPLGVTPTASGADTQLALIVPRTGTAATLKVSIRGGTGAPYSGRVDFAPADNQKTLTVILPGKGDFVVFVEGYQAKTTTSP